MSKEIQKEVLVNYLKSLLTEKDDKIKELEDKIIKLNNFNNNFEKTINSIVDDKDKEIATLKAVIDNRDEQINQLNEKSKKEQLSSADTFNKLCKIRDELVIKNIKKLKENNNLVYKMFKDEEERFNVYKKSLIKFLQENQRFKYVFANEGTGLMSSLYRPLKALTKDEHFIVSKKTGNKFEI